MFEVGYVADVGAGEEFQALEVVLVFGAVFQFDLRCLLIQGDYFTERLLRDLTRECLIRGGVLLGIGYDEDFEALY